MKHARSLALVLAVLAGPLFPQPLRADAEVSFTYFQEALSPFGEWIEVADYGLCWRPTGVAEDWAPYTDGYWAYTDAGWTWVSYEDWGGITYHYGRWIHLVDEGWVWVPEYEWGPAWVSWRSNDDYVGWAPLPPEARWEQDTGFSTWVDTSYDIGPESYRFCHTRDFGAPVLAPVLLPCERSVTIIVNTVNITNIVFNRPNSRVFCGGPDFGRINRHVHRPIPSMKLHCEDREVRGAHGHRTPQVVRGNQIALYAPKVQRPADIKALPITPRRVVGADKVNRGWSRVPDLAAQEKIKQRLQKQNEGLNPRTAPARPVRPADLADVPTKADPAAKPPTAIVRERPGLGRNPERPVLPTVPRQPQRPAVPAARPPVVAERVESSENSRPKETRPVAERSPGTPPQSRPEPSRPPQVAVPEVGARAAEVARGRAQREQAENAQRSALARQQTESAQRAEQSRERQMQQQQNEQRAAEARSQEVQARRQQAEVANRQQENVQRVQRTNEARQQVIQQQQAAQRANEMRQQAAHQQQAAQRANEMRQHAAQQQQVAQRANEARQQAAQHQQAAQRANEMRQQQQQPRQVPTPQREHVAPPSRPPQQQQPQSRPAQAEKKEGDDNKRQRSGR